MEYLRRTDFASLNSGAGRTTQVLLDRLSGATTAKAVVVRLTPGEGSPRGSHEHRFDQSGSVLGGKVHVDIGGADLELSTPLPEEGESRESADQVFDEATQRGVSPKR